MLACCNKTQCSFKAVQQHHKKKTYREAGNLARRPTNTTAHIEHAHAGLRVLSVVELGHKCPQSLTHPQTEPRGERELVPSDGLSERLAAIPRCKVERVAPSIPAQVRDGNHWSGSINAEPLRTRKSQ